MFRLIFFFSLIILSFLGSRKFQEVEEELSINPKRREERAAVNFFSWKGYRKVLFRTPNPGSVFFLHILLCEGTMNITWKIICVWKWLSRRSVIILVPLVLVSHLKGKCEQISFYLVYSTCHKHGIPRQSSH